MRRVTMQGTQQTAAGATTQNVATGQAYERAPFSGMCRVSLVGEAAGESRCSIFAGGRLVMQESPISRQNRFPVIPDDVVATFPIRQGDQITIPHRNTGAGANTIFWRVDMAG